MAGLSALGLVLNACPFGVSEKPDGFANVTGRVQVRQGPSYSGRVHISCWRPPGPGPTFFRDPRVDAQSAYNIVMEAPYGSDSRPGEPFEFLCKAQAGPPRGTPFAVRYVTVPFSAVRGERPTTRIDLREGEVESPPPGAYLPGRPSALTGEEHP